MLFRIATTILLLLLILSLKLCLLKLSNFPDFLNSIFCGFTRNKSVNGKLVDYKGVVLLCAYMHPYIVRACTYAHNTSGPWNLMLSGHANY